MSPSVFWFGCRSPSGSGLWKLRACCCDAQASKGEHGWMSQTFTDEGISYNDLTDLLNLGSHTFTSPLALNHINKLLIGSLSLWEEWCCYVLWLHMTVFMDVTVLLWTWYCYGHDSAAMDMTVLLRTWQCCYRHSSVATDVTVLLRTWQYCYGHDSVARCDKCCYGHDSVAMDMTSIAMDMTVLLWIWHIAMDMTWTWQYCYGRDSVTMDVTVLLWT